MMKSSSRQRAGVDTATSSPGGIEQTRSIHTIANSNNSNITGLSNQDANRSKRGVHCASNSMDLSHAHGITHRGQGSDRAGVMSVIRESHDTGGNVYEGYGSNIYSNHPSISLQSVATNGFNFISTQQFINDLVTLGISTEETNGTTGGGPITADNHRSTQSSSMHPQVESSPVSPAQRYFHTPSSINQSSPAHSNAPSSYHLSSPAYDQRHQHVSVQQPMHHQSVHDHPSIARRESPAAVIDVDPWGSPLVTVRDKSQSVLVGASVGGMYNSPGSSRARRGNPMYGSGSENPSMSGQRLVEDNPKSQSELGDMSIGGIYNSPGMSDVEGSNPMHGSGSNGRPTMRQHLVSGMDGSFSASTSSAVASVAGPNLILGKDGRVSSAAVSSAAGTVLVHSGTGPTGSSGRSANLTTVSHSTTTSSAAANHNFVSAAANEKFADVELSYENCNG